MTLFKPDSIPLIGELVHVEIDAPQSKAVYNKTLTEVVTGFYHLRNYECYRYFNESYLSLYLRGEIYKRRIDLDKLEALKMLRPIQILDFKNTIKAIPPPPEQERMN